MSKPFGEKRVIALIVIGCILAVLAAADPWGTGSVSRRTLGALFVGPCLLGYAFYGLHRLSFPELSEASVSESRPTFWFLFAAFFATGMALIILGLRAVAAI